MAVEQVATGAGPPPALVHLRQGTQVAHERLDSALTDADGAVREPERYVRLLATLSLLHAQADEPLRRWARSRRWVRRHVEPRLLPRRAPLYAADLAVLERADLAVPPVRGACDDARGLGYLYVVAGSSTGARVVRQGLPDELAPRARSGLDDAAAGGAQLWVACRRLLAEPLAGPLVARAAEEAAALFGLLLDDVASDHVRGAT